MSKSTLSVAHEVGRNLQLAPVTPAVAELLHRLQQEAAEAVAPASGAVTLALLPMAHVSSALSGTYMTAYDASFTHRITTVLSHSRQKMPKWYGEEVRRDSIGRRWERSFDAVVDDFGDLVEVQP